MNSRNKNIFSIQIGAFFLAMVFIFIQFGPYIVFKAEQYQIKKQIKKHIKLGVNESELFTFSVKISNEKGFVWEKEDKEFHYGNSMYDIVRVEMVNGELVYKCINDKQEHELFAHLDEMVKDFMNEKSVPSKKYAKLISFLFFESPEVIKVESYKTAINHHQRLIQRTNKGYHSNCSPPPNLI